MTNITTNSTTKLNFTYIFCGKHNKPEQFVMLPKFVLDMHISCRAKLLYSLMLDRAKLSLENHWSDFQGKVYIKFSVMSIQKILDCSKNTATNVLEELKRHELIEAKKDEFGKCNKIFVKYPEQKEEQKPDEKPDKEPKKQENDEKSYQQDSLDIKSYPQKSDSYQHVRDSQKQNIGALSQILTPLSQILTSLSQILTPNHTNIINTNSINNQSSIYNNTKTDTYDVDMDMIEQQQDYKNYQKSIKENIDYIKLKEKYDTDTINDIVDIICDVMISDHKTTRVNGQNISTELVKNTFMKLKMSNIEYALECLKMTPKINNIRAYLITTLYNSTKTRHLFYTYAAASEVSKTKQEYSKSVKQNRFVNYKQRERDFEELERLARERLKNSTTDFELAWGEDGHILRDENNNPIKIYPNQELPSNIVKSENGKYYIKICDTQK